MDTSGERHAGTFTGDDLAGFAAHYEDPVTFTWNGWTVAKPGLWSQGPVFLQQLALLADGSTTRTPDYYHTLIEGTKLAMADREAWYGDSADVSLETLLSPAYNETRRDARRCAGLPRAAAGAPGRAETQARQAHRAGRHTSAGTGGRR